MAVKIFDAESLVAGTLQSVELTLVGDLVLDAELAGMTEDVSITFELKALDGATNAIYKPVTSGTEMQAVKVSRGKNGVFRQSITGVNSLSVYLFVTVPKTISGTLTVETTQSANPLS